MKFGFGNVAFCCSCKSHIAWLLYTPAILDPCPLLDYHWWYYLPVSIYKCKVDVVSPCSLATCWKVRTFLHPSTLTSLGTFCTPVSSPLHIWEGDTIPHFSFICFNSWNQSPITLGFAPMALAMERLRAFLMIIFGCLLRKPFSHLRPALPVSPLKPFRLFTCAYWYANSQTRLIVRGNPLNWNL